MKNFNLYDYYEEVKKENELKYYKEQVSKLNDLLKKYGFNTLEELERFLKKL